MGLKTYKVVHEYSLTQVRPGLEGSIGYEFNPAGPLSFGIEARLMYVRRVRDISTYEDILIEGKGLLPSATPSYKFADYKEGYEIGGFSYGLGVNLTCLF